MPGIQRVIRLEIQGVTYEATEDEDGEQVIVVSGNGIEQEFELSEEDAENLLHFLEEFQDLGQQGQRGRGRMSGRHRGDDDEEDRSGRYSGSTVAYRGRSSSHREQDERPLARNLDGSIDKRVGPRAPNDTRGKVLDPEHDGRLRGNEDERPNDPDRSRQRAGGRRGGNRGRAQEQE